MTLEEVIQGGDYTLVDVREPMELMMDGEIAGAQNIPLGEVEERTDEILAMKQPIIIYCRSGNRSGKAMEYLQSQGVTEIYNGGGWADLKTKLGK